MNAKDIMTRNVISVPPTATITDAVRLMIDNRLSGLPVIDTSGALVGIVTEGDFLHRAELGTEKPRSRWIEFLTGPVKTATDYVEAHSRKISDIMTKTVEVVNEDTRLDEIVRILETKHIKRVPVVRDGKVTGIVSRANLLHALAATAPSVESPATDSGIRESVLAEIDTHLRGIGRCDVVVKDGVVDLWGVVYGNKDAIRVAAENVPGVKQVRDNMVWMDPFSGTIIETPLGDSKANQEKK